MKPRRLPPPLAIALGWAACIVAFGVARDWLAERGPLEWLAAALLLAAAALLGLGLAGRLSAATLERLTGAIGPSLLPLSMLVVIAGGVRSPAVAVLALSALGLSVRRGLGAGVASVAASLVLVVLGDAWLGRGIGSWAIVSAAVVLAAGGVAPIWYLRRSSATGDEARRQLARVEGYVVRRRQRTPPGGERPVDLAQDKEAIPDQADRLVRLRSFDEYLRDVRDRTGADEVVFWRQDDESDELRPMSTSTEGAEATAYFDDERWGPLLRWTAETGIVHADHEDDVVHCVTAPVSRDDRPYGALSISSTAGLTLTRQGALEWAERYGRHVALLVQLFDVRSEHGRERRRSRLLVRVAEAIHRGGTTEGVARTICEAAIQLTSGQRAALIQWDSRLEQGSIRATAGDHPLAERFRVPADSMIGRQCIAGLPLHMRDARPLAVSRAAVFAAGEPARRLGSLSIVPLERDRMVVGAIVVEDDRLEAVSSGEQKNLILLATIAAGSLQLFEQIAEATRSARTDALTGLYNRRHFDEELARVFSDASRHRDETSLVIADIDHFKRVNDSYGHEAGDAVLQHVSRLLQDRVRPVDVCARFGGEEIVILCPRTGLDGARLLAERLREAIAAAPLRHEGLDIAVTASFGVASHPRSVRDSDGLLGAADGALYAAKREGRNRVRSADASSDATLR